MSSPTSRPLRWHMNDARRHPMRNPPRSPPPGELTPSRLRHVVQTEVVTATSVADLGAVYVRSILLRNAHERESLIRVTFMAAYATNLSHSQRDFVKKMRAVMNSVYRCA